MSDFFKQPYAGSVMAALIAVCGVIATQVVSLALARFQHRSQLEKDNFAKNLENDLARKRERQDSLIEVCSLLFEFQIVAVQGNELIKLATSPSNPLEHTPSDITNALEARNALAKRIITQGDRYGLIPIELKAEQRVVSAVLEIVIGDVVIRFQEITPNQAAEIISDCRTAFRALLAFERGELEPAKMLGMFCNKPLIWLKDNRKATDA